MNEWRFPFNPELGKRAIIREAGLLESVLDFGGLVIKLMKASTALWPGSKVRVLEIGDDYVHVEFVADNHGDPVTNGPHFKGQRSARRLECR